MKELVVKVKNKLGLHARPAAMFVQEASRFKSAVTVVKDGVSVNGKSIMGLMLLAAESGSALKITLAGPDEAQAADTLRALFEDGFGEK